MVFPAVVFLFLASSRHLVWAQGRLRQIAVVCSVVYLLADYAENITLSGVLNEDGAAFTAAKVGRAATFTLIKWAAMVATLVLVAVGWLRARRA